MKAIVITACADAKTNRHMPVGEMVDFSAARVKAGIENGLLRAATADEIAMAAEQEKAERAEAAKAKKAAEKEQAEDE